MWSARSNEPSRGMLLVVVDDLLELAALRGELLDDPRRALHASARHQPKVPSAADGVDRTIGGFALRVLGVSRLSAEDALPLELALDDAEAVASRSGSSCASVGTFRAVRTYVRDLAGLRSGSIPARSRPRPGRAGGDGRTRAPFHEPRKRARARRRVRARRLTEVRGRGRPMARQVRARGTRRSSRRRAARGCGARVSPWAEVRACGEDVTAAALTWTGRDRSERASGRLSSSASCFKRAGLPIGGSQGVVAFMQPPGPTCPAFEHASTVSPVPLAAVVAALRDSNDGGRA